MNFIQLNVAKDVVKLCEGIFYVVSQWYHLIKQLGDNERRRSGQQEKG